MQRVIVFIIISIAALFIARKIWTTLRSKTTAHCGGSCSACNAKGETLPNANACTPKTDD